MTRSHRYAPIRARGIGLVEVMVALAIGLAATLVIMQVYSLAEQRRRSTTGSGDAQAVSAILFNQLRQEVSQAGFGFNAPAVFGCNAVWTVASTGADIVTPVPLAPVTINPAESIIPAGDANTDTLLVMYGNTDGQPQGNAINAQSGSVYSVQNASSFSVDDRVLAVPVACGPSTSLTLDKVTQVAATTVTTEGSSAGATFYNLGRAPSVLAYAIRSGQLTVCDYMQHDCGVADTDDASIWIPLASDIVGLRAQYGRNTGATELTYDQATPTNGCGWAGVPAVRLALVARSSQPEATIVTRTALNGTPVNAPAWPGEEDAPLVAATGALGPDAAADEPWKHYRYKVLWAQLPIRNTIWMEGGGCP